jgi:hypothetical protein
LLEVFRDWEIRNSDRSKLDNFVSRLAKGLPSGWTRDKGREKELAGSSGKGSLVVFRIDLTTGLPPARLYLAHDPTVLKVTNIVPQETSELTRFQYNSILLSFQSIAEPFAANLGLDINLTSDQENVSDLMTARAMKALQTFSVAANKSTGTSHPLDHARWLKFLILAHKDGADLDPETLTRWLIEEDEWYEDQAVKLAISYEFARNLLAEYDKSKSE